MIRSRAQLTPIHRPARTSSHVLSCGSRRLPSPVVSPEGAVARPCRAGAWPPSTQRDLRALTRTRSTLVEERARGVKRLQKLLEAAHLKLAAVAFAIVAPAITGLSARAILEALLAGQTDPAQLAAEARGNLRVQRDQVRPARAGQLRPPPAFVRAEHVGHIDYRDDSLARLSHDSAAQVRPCAAEVTLLETLPLGSQRAAEILRAAIGAARRRFPSAPHLATWAGRCPGNTASAGKRQSGKTRKGRRWLRQVLLEGAHAAARTKETYLYGYARVSPLSPSGRQTGHQEGAGGAGAHAVGDRLPRAGRTGSLSRARRQLLR
jgi:transposase